jgi:hypothetical protein
VCPHSESLAKTRNNKEDPEQPRPKDRKCRVHALCQTLALRPLYIPCKFNVMPHANALSGLGERAGLWPDVACYQKQYEMRTRLPSMALLVIELADLRRAGTAVVPFKGGVVQIILAFDNFKILAYSVCRSAARKVSSSGSGGGFQRESLSEGAASGPTLSGFFPPCREPGVPWLPAVQCEDIPDIRGALPWRHAVSA